MTSGGRGEPGEPKPRPAGWQWARLAGTVARCAAATAFLAAGFFALGFLYHCEGSGSRLIRNDDTLPLAQELGIACAQVFFCLTLLVDIQMNVLQGLRRSWRWLALVPIGLMTLTGGLFAGFLFLGETEGPKAFMLVSGGALVCLLGATVQLMLRPDFLVAAAGAEPVGDLPAAWYAAVVLLGAAFLGGMHGWMAPSPYLKGLLRHRADQWTNKSASDPIPFPDDKQIVP